MSTAAAPPPPPARRRSFGSPGDLVRSLLVVLGFALLVVWLTPRPDAASVRVIDYSAQLAQARDGGVPFPAYAPVGLPSGWRPTSARIERSGNAGVVWHLGFITPADRYASLDQTDTDPNDFVRKVSSEGIPEGEATIAGTVWQRRYREANDQRTLWRSDGRSTVAVNGNAPWAELEQLAAALRTG